MTLYLLDANVLIQAHEDYYPVDRIPQFWAWLLEMAAQNIIKVPRVIFEEVTPPPGPLADWVKQKEVRDLMILSEPIARARVTHVLVHGYAPDLTDVETEKIAKDPFLVAAAMATPDGIVVTREVSKPRRQRANRKVPDICDVFSVPVITDFQLYRVLQFSIPSSLVAPCRRNSRLSRSIRMLGWFGGGRVVSPTALAPASSALEANAAAQLAPVRRIERPQLRAYRHGLCRLLPKHA